MRIQITRPGIFNSEGKQIEVGTEIDVKDEPKGWAGRYTVLREAKAGKTAVTNPKGAKDPAVVELEGHTVDELKQLADSENVDLKGASAKGDMIDHILKARAAKQG